MLIASRREAAQIRTASGDGRIVRAPLFVIPQDPDAAAGASGAALIDALALAAGRDMQHPETYDADLEEHLYAAKPQVMGDEQVDQMLATYRSIAAAS